MRRFLLLTLCLILVIPSAQAAEREKYVALTFDDGPSGRFTRRLLDGLRDREAKATFFLCGYRIEAYPEEMQRIYNEGHEIGLHGFSHKCMEPMSRRQIAAELADTRALLPKNCETLWLRPPGGRVSDGVRQVAEVTGLSILDWSVDPRDWATHDTAAISSNVLDQVKDGDVVLLHDMSDSSVDAALDIIDRLRQRGFRFVTVSELTRLRRTDPKPGKIYTSFPPVQDSLPGRQTPAEK